MADHRFPFVIPIGDWSGDGHDRCAHIHASAKKPIDAVREAFFAAQEKLPALDPTTFCRKLGDDKLPARVKRILLDLDPALDPDELDDANGMALYVAWFLNQGDPDLDVQIAAEPELEMLHFHGEDSKKRHIGSIGYALMDY